MDENYRSSRRLLNKKNQGRDSESIPVTTTIDSRLDYYQRSMISGCSSYNFGFSSWLHRRRILTKLCRMTMVIILSTGLINLIFMLDVTGYNKLKYTSDGPLTTQEQSSSPQSHQQRFITVEILSSQEKADISVEGATIMEEGGGGGRGIHVVVLHQSTGAVLARRQFDTYSPHEDESMSLFLNLVRKGRIIIMAVKDEASYELKKPTRMLLKQKFGSDYIGQLDWRDMWIHVVQKGRPNSLCEQLSRNPDLQNWAPPLSLTCLVPLTHQLEDSECQWSSSIEEDERRREFCNQVEGYGSVCDCQEPAPITFQPAPIADNQIRDVPIVVVAASTRPHYLYRMLRTLLSTKGADASMVTVFIDGFAIEPMQVARLFGLRAVQHMPVGLKAVARVTQHYKSALAAIFRLYPSAKRAIIIEEDLDVSPDFFQYFSQLAHLLDEDKTLFCISAWNDYSYQHASANPSLIYRVETMPGLGWMINKEIQQELEPIWPTPDKNWDWDMWMRGYTMKRRECLIPDVSRTYHFGVKGIHMNPATHDNYFKKRAFNNIPDVKLNDVHKLKSVEYERTVEEAIRNAFVVNHKISPCNESFIPDVTGKAYVLFIKMNSPHDRTAWVRIAKCFGIWDQDGRADHKGLWRLHLKTNPVFVVGVPYSPYSKFKPPELVPLSMNHTVTKVIKRRRRKH